MEDQQAIDKFREELREPLESVGERLVQMYSAEMQVLGLGPFEVDYRVKSLDSFASKLLIKGDRYQPDPLAQMHDKLGVRIEVMRLAELEIVVEMVRRLAGAARVEVEGKGGEDDVPGMGYTAVHVDLVPMDLLGAIPEEHGFVEVQCRTMAHGLWAAQVHDLGYKGVLAPDRDQQRKLDRLPILMSIFDEEVLRVRDELLGDPRYPLHRIVQELRRQRGRIGRPDRGQPELTAEFVQALLECTDRESVIPELAQWVEAHAEKLEELLREYADTGRQVYVDRPEGLLAFFLLDTAAIKTARAWDRAGRPRAWLTDLADVWGAPLPEPV